MPLPRPAWPRPRHGESALRPASAATSVSSRQKRALRAAAPTSRRRSRPQQSVGLCAYGYEAAQPGFVGEVRSGTLSTSPRVEQPPAREKRPEEPHGGVALPRTTSPIRTSGRGVKVQPETTSRNENL